MKVLRNNYIYILAGFIIVFFIIYFRLIYVRIPRELYLNPHWSLLLIYLLTIFMILINIILHCLTILKNMKILTKSNPSKIKLFFSKKASLVKHIFSKSLLSFEHFMNVYFTDINFKICFEIMYYATINIVYVKIQIVTWIFDYIPRLIISICFIYDIFYLQTLNYFFKVIPLFILPIIYNYICFTIKKICEINIDNCGRYLTIYDYKEQINIPNPWTYVKLISHRVNPPDRLDYYFSDNFLLNDNLSLFKFGLSQEYLKQNEIEFSLLSDKQVTDRLYNLYLGFHQTYILPFLYIIRIEIYRSSLDALLGLLNSLIYLFGWSYILLYSLGYI